MRWTFVVFVVAMWLEIVVQAMPLDDIDEQQMVSNCNKLCRQCGCLGFYCGDECLCECDSEHPNDIKCLKGIAENSAKLRVPFEVLIQAPSNNRQLRSVMDLREGNERHHYKDFTPIGSARKTVRIYEPIRVKREIDQTTVTSRKAFPNRLMLQAKDGSIKKINRFRNMAATEAGLSEAPVDNPTMAPAGKKDLISDERLQKKRNTDVVGQPINKARARLQEAKQRQQRRSRTQKTKLLRATRKPTPTRKRMLPRRPNRPLVALQPRNTMGILGKNSDEHAAT